MSKPSVSIVIPTHNEGKDVLATIDCILRNSQIEHLQLIVVDDGSTDHSTASLLVLAEQGLIELVRGSGLGAIGARNRGSELAQADIIGFVDAHCYTPKGWLKPLLDEFERSPLVAALSPVIGSLNNFQAKGYGATWINDELAMHWLPQTDHVTEVPFIGGAATFVRKAIFQRLSGFDDGIVQWGFEDMELSIRLWLFGYPIVVVPDSTIYHKFRTRFPYNIDYSEVCYNKLRMIFLHFEGKRLSRLLKHHLRYPCAEKGLKRLYQDGSEERRDYLLANRVQNMDSFCDRFRLVS